MSQSAQDIVPHRQTEDYIRRVDNTSHLPPAIYGALKRGYAILVFRLDGDPPLVRSVYMMAGNDVHVFRPHYPITSADAASLVGPNPCLGVWGAY